MAIKNLLSQLIPCGCFNAFKNQETDFIREFGPWVLVLNRQQNFLGRTLILLKTHRTDFADLDPLELLLFLSAYRHWKTAMDEAFGPDKYNISLLGNEEHMHGGHLHGHFVPRYRRSIEFAGEIFQYDTPEIQVLNYSRVDEKRVYPLNIRRLIKEIILNHWPQHLAVKK